MKKFLMGILGLLILIPGMVYASEARIGEEEYATFEEAYATIDAGESETIILLNDVVLEKTMEISGRDVIIDMNSFDISATQYVFKVFNAKVEFKGTGTIKETSPYYGAVILKGSTDEEETEYSYVIVGANVTLEGWAPLFIDQSVSGELHSNYGIKADVYGKLNALNDTGGDHGFGVYVNGTIKNKNNAPIINIHDGAEITSTGSGFFLAGYTVTTVGEAEIEGVDSGISMKSGKLTINGAYVTCDGENEMPTAGNNNGINPSGAALQIESNSGYAGDMEIVINDGYLSSSYAVAIYEYIGAGTETKVNKFDIKGGAFNSIANVLELSEQFIDKFKGFITGGTFSNNISQYVPAGYKSVYGSSSGFNVTSATVPTGTSNLSGTITNGADVTVQLKQGGLVVQSTVANENGLYAFEDVASGSYNMVISSGNHQMLIYINVNTENMVKDFTFVENSLILDQEANTPNVVVNSGSLNLTNHLIAIGYVELTEGVGNNVFLEDVESINTLAPKSNKVFFDISIYNDDNRVEELDEAIEFIVDFDFKNKQDFEVYRSHDEVATKLTKLSVRPTADFVDGTFYADTVNNKLYIYTKKFSVYGVGYTSITNPKTGDNIINIIALGSISLFVLLGLSFYSKKKTLLINK